jgi:hypothetical protein
MLELLAATLLSSQTPRYARVAFPRDPSVVDAKRDFGARGDGKTDDTASLQKALDFSSGLTDGKSRILFLPNGTYRLTKTLVQNSSLGPWVFGESRDGVVLRLDSGVKGITSVVRTHPRDADPGSADWFMRTIKNLTIDVGNNPETDGIRFFSNNTGLLQNVRIIGNGKVGVNGFMGQNGPNLVQDVTVEGFETGISSEWLWGQTLSRVTVRGAKKRGVFVQANSVAIEDLRTFDVPEPLFVEFPNDWTWWGGVAAVVGGRFEGKFPAKPAIRNRSILYARAPSQKGYAKLIASETPGGDADGATVGTYLSHPAKSLFDSPPLSLGLPIKPEPTFAWETDPSKWLCANDYGVIGGDNQDDTEAFRRAFAAAAKAGKTVVYVRGIGGPDPNHYQINAPITIPKPVRHVLGLGFGRILGTREGRFLVTDDSAPLVKFEFIDAFGGPPIALENRSQKNTMFVESCGVRVIGSGKGDIFVTNVPGLIELGPGQKLWARGLNPEGDSDTGLVTNRGGDLWVLGIKHEGRGVRFGTLAGGRTELFGVFVYGPGIAGDDRRPLFAVDDASLTVAGLREIVFGGNAYLGKVREKRAGVERSLTAEAEPGWIGWSLFSAWRRGG